MYKKQGLVKIENFRKADFNKNQPISSLKISYNIHIQHYTSIIK